MSCASARAMPPWRTSMFVAWTVPALKSVMSFMSSPGVAAQQRRFGVRPLSCHRSAVGTRVWVRVGRADTVAGAAAEGSVDMKRSATIGVIGLAALGGLGLGALLSNLG